MDDMMKNQMMYLVAWQMIKKLCADENIDKSLAEKLNERNAEILMCDCLPIG